MLNFSFITTNCWRSTRFSATRFEVSLNFGQINKTKFPSVSIMIPGWHMHANLSIISESTNNCEGQGKSFLACAFAQKACREEFNTLYLRMTKLFEDLSLAKGDGRYLKLLASFAKADLLVLDDYGLGPLNQEQRHDFLEILEDRHDLKSTLVTSQLPIEHWHEQIGDPTLADAILDRLVHSAHKIKLEGESMRKKKANLT
jgi:hypothetical protein